MASSIIFFLIILSSELSIRAIAFVVDVVVSVFALQCNTKRGR
jgi:hypothetical protein